MNKNLIISSLLVLLLAASLYRPVWAQTANNNSTAASSFAAIANLERMRAQTQLAEKDLAAGDRDGAFAHAFISHSTIFPSIKDNLDGLDKQLSVQLESMLTDFAFKIKDGSLSAQDAGQQSRAIGAMIDGISAKTGESSDKAVVSEVTVLLLRDASQSYKLFASGSQKVDYENAAGLVSLAKAKYQSIAGAMDASRRAEVDSFFSDLDSSIALKGTPESVSSNVAAIERDLAENLSQTVGSGGYSQYFATIRTLYSQLLGQVKSGNYAQAEQTGISAYLDNFEYLEAPLEKHDAKLKDSLEQKMRVELRDMITTRQSPQAIGAFVDEIIADLGRAEDLLKGDAGYASSTASSNSFADIQGLSQGFGAYEGPRKERGDAADAAKAEVRKNIDQIRAKLDETLHLYQTGDAQAAIQASRSAYLDSYENIELPLRPINPDFTLEMEIKFAELRNLMQGAAPYDSVAAKVVEIRRGLDESERQVTGTGSLAPAIAFSTSFSIIFREGLESALIIGAILTYLEASRNERFKRHVYYGIALAFAGTAATWFAAQYLIEISGASKSMIEALAGVSAVGVLFWVSFWILNKVETKKWIEFVKAKVWKATATGSVMVFVMLSFFTIYREGFETVLFYQAMLSFAKYMEWYVAAGLILGLGLIAGVTFVVRKFGKKLPLRVLFALTMGIGAYMSVAFMGNAIREFQEVGYIQTTHVEAIPRLDINTAAMTGIHPTLETTVAQLVLTAVYLAGSAYVLVIQPRRQKAVASARKSRADLDGGKKAGIDVEDR